MLLPLRQRYKASAPLPEGSAARREAKRRGSE